MKTNEHLQKDVQEAIKWEPLLKETEIGVIANDGIITLVGIVDSYSKKIEAEDAAKNVEGVKAVVEKIEIKFSNAHKITDTEIAGEVLNAFKYNWEVPGEKIKIKVEDGWVTLEGELQWNHQKEAAQKTTSRLMGVKGVTNYIQIKTQTSDEIEKKDIESALARNWSIIDKDIKVNVLGNRVTLRGKVNSWYQKVEAERIAWKAPGVVAVDNELIIEYEYSYSLID